MQIDLISDIHGDLERMESLLEALGYDLDSHRHPEGRRALFLGDFIDRGPRNLAVLRRMDAMRKADSALAIMGNHELNAILFHADDGRGDGLRKRTEANTHHHETFLREAPLGSAEAAEALSIMMGLPLFADLGGLRAVHAYWRDDVMAEIVRRRPDGRIRAEDLPEIALDREGSPFGVAVTMAAKGPEADLPPGSWYADKHGKKRDAVRMCWWAPAADFHSAIISCPDLTNIPNRPVPAHVAELIYPADAPPVAFGHYQLPDEAALGANTLCLDVPGRPMAYRWDGEQQFDPEKLLAPAARSPEPG